MTVKILVFLAAVFPLTNSRLVGQDPEVTRASISLFTGISGGTSLWNINRQRVGIFNNTGLETGVDTIILGRKLRQSLALGMAITFYPTNYLGWSFEASYFSFKKDDNCAHVFDSTNGLSDAVADMCLSIDRRSRGSGSLNLILSGILRPDLGGPARPYLRVIGGFADRGGSTVEMSGNWFGQERQLIIDPDGSTMRATAGLALGVTIPAAPGYNLRWEIRDQLHRRDVLTGPANALAVAPTQQQWKHNVAVLIGIDIVLEKRRGRRY